MSIWIETYNHVFQKIDHTIIRVQRINSFISFYQDDISYRPMDHVKSIFFLLFRILTIAIKSKASFEGIVEY